MQLTYMWDSEENKLVDLIEPVIQDTVWNVLETDMKDESKSKVLHTSAAMLAFGWRTGQLAVVIDKNHIIACRAVMPLITAKQRTFLEQQLGCELPPINIYRSMMAWTHRQWEGQGISTALRKCLHDQEKYSNSLLISSTFGFGASSKILKTADWELVSWDRLPFVSSLMTWFEESRYYSVFLDNYFEMGTYRPYYQNNEIDNLNDYYLLWVNNQKLALEIENSLSQVILIDNWRNGIKSLFKGKSAQFAEL